MKTKKYFFTVIALISFSFMVSGCAVNFYKQNPRTKTKIKNLKTQISDLEAQRGRERKQFEEVKRKLEQKLHGHITDQSISLEVGDRGLVIILSDDVLFDSGKAEIKAGAFSMLNKVAKIIKDEVPDKNIGISGHTDNVQIQHSQWKSNWELSTARSTNVLHYLIGRDLKPSKLSATGYGEHRPIASNVSEEGRGKNRRVEIVILPDFIEKRGGLGSSDEGFIK